VCDAFSIPVITLVDSMGLASCEESENAPFAADLAKLAMAYAKSVTPKITIILGHAIGASFAILGSKALGADIAYALDNAEIGALASEASVAFAWSNLINPDKSREELIDEWRKSLSSPVAAASLGEIDDIVSTNELRARICSALQMLAAKSTGYPRLHAVDPL
jgi:propionyl-CoA carboxylase beta chain